MNLFSHDERQGPPGSGDDSPLHRGRVVAQTSRDPEAAEYGIYGPFVVGPASPPEDGSCGHLGRKWNV